MKYMKKRDGFTLIEMLIVIAIMAVMATIFLSYDRSGERQVILIGEQAKVVALLNRAKTLAMGRGSDGTFEDVRSFGVSEVKVSISGQTLTVTKNGEATSVGTITLDNRVAITGNEISFFGPSLESTGGFLTLSSPSTNSVTIEITPAGAITYR